MADGRIYHLLEKLFRDDCTEPEKQELARWISESGNGEEQRQILEKIWSRYQPVHTMPSQKADRILAAILKTEPGNEKAMPFRVRRVSFLRLVAAACVLLAMGFLGYFLFAGKKEKTVPKIAITKKVLQNDVAPGGNKATLTLGNGRKIILDSAGNGTLASQGNVKVLKLASGQLAYNGLNEKPSEIVFNTLATPPGGQYSLVLPDGSKVWLDASSSITYPTAFTGRQRRVEISGQAYFEVTRNESLPFIVQKDGLSIQVLGTHFNVNAYDDEGEIKTTLLEGSVKVVQGGTGALLAPGEQVQVTKKGGFKLVKNADLEEVIAWKNGFFRFNRSDLQTVMRQLARWYDVEVIYQGNIPPQHFGGKMERDLNLSEILEGLEKSLVHFKIEGKKLIVMP